MLPKNAKKFDENFLKYWGLSGAQACNFCRSRQELSNEHLPSQFGVDTAENEPLKVLLIIQPWDLIFTEPPPPPCLPRWAKMGRLGRNSPKIWSGSTGRSSNPTRRTPASTASRACSNQTWKTAGSAWRRCRMRLRQARITYPDWSMRWDFTSRRHFSSSFSGFASPGTPAWIRVLYAYSGSLKCNMILLINPLTAALWSHDRLRLFICITIR